MKDTINMALRDWEPELRNIRIDLGLPEVLAQLAEEAAELAQAALKMRRALDKGNPTPVPLADAEAALEEEFGDVVLCMSIVGVDQDAIGRTIRSKSARWTSRLEEA